jgi:hypothetical protein
MDRFAGRGWEQRYDALGAAREQQELVATTEEAHGTWDGEPVWAGVRRTDEARSAAGVYGWFEDREGRKRLQFRPVMADLDHGEAEMAAEAIRDRLKAEAREIEHQDDVRPTLDFDI